MKILITAGPTWVKIDQVRILTTIFTGRTGLALAKAFKKTGHQVTLLVNSHCLGEIKGIRTVEFCYFDQLKQNLIQELQNNKYDAVIHSAAVSDYILKKPFTGKIASGKLELVVRLSPAEKLIKLIKRLNPQAYLIQFKLEIQRKGLIDIAYASLKHNNSDYVVANAWEDLENGYKAFFINRDKNIINLNSLNQLFRVIHKSICEHF
jgi:phosphopantothenoylcysteine synthetase/decarboxylase